MFVLNFKMKRRKKAWIFALVALVLAGVVFAVAKSGSGKSGMTATCDEIGEYSLAAQTEEQRLDILRAFGIESAELTESDEVTIPEDFNSVTEKYNELQKQTGLDLTPYKGKKAERLTYSLSGKTGGCAVLLISDGKLIGGHVTSREYGDEPKALALSEIEN